MKKVLKKRTGFTLVELLIVIIIIGILAGAMLLVAGSGTDKAEATKIVSDLRGMKAAMLMYYADHPSEGKAPSVTSLEPYMDREIKTADYLPFSSGDTAPWYIGRISFPSDGVKAKLKDVAKDVGLLQGTKISPAAPATEYTDGAGAWMKAR